MRIDPALHQPGHLTFTLLGGSDNPEFTGYITQSRGKRMTVLVDSVVPAGCLFRASHAGRVLLGEVVACDAASGRWEASLQVYCKSGEERAAHAGGPVSVLPELLALNAHLSEACACNPEPRGVRIPRS